MRDSPRLKFLLIDDDPDDADIFVTYFQREFKSITVDTVLTLPEDLHGICNKYDAVIVDYYLDGHTSTGLDFARMLHQHNWRMPVVLLSGQDVEEVEGLDLWQYADAVLSKNDPDGCTGRMHALIRWLARLREAS